MELEKTENLGSAKTYVSQDYSPPSPAKKRLKKLGVGLIILIVLLGIGWFLQQQGILSKLTLSVSQLRQEFFSLESPVAPLTKPNPPAPAAQVTISSTGFLPQTLLIKKGTKVIWTNKDNQPHQIASDPHPIHSLLPALGKGKNLSPGSSHTFTFDKTGTFTYHDEENPLKFKGVVIVK